MNNLFKDAAHLFRLAAIFVATVVLFLLIRSLLVPSDFGLYGHYRAGAIDDNRERSMVYAGREVCADCHTEIVETQQGSRHGAISCEACHGPQPAHVDDPVAVQPERPPVIETCLVCHARKVGQPDFFPAIEVSEHAGEDSCADCHAVHHPDMDEE